MPLHTKTSAYAKECPECGSSDLEVDPRDGQTVCVQCGAVVERNLIVQETQFEEAPSGSSHAVGQYVSHDPSADAFTSEWRKHTLRKNQALIRQYAERLKLPTHISDNSFKLYKQLLSMKGTFGRTLEATLAACIYVCCRKQRECIMMYDISVQLHLDVRDLQRAYHHVSDTLKIYVDTVDPASYIEKYVFLLKDVTSDTDDRVGLRLASSGAGTRDLIRLATRIVESMQEDGIDQGRRPGPVCAAALLAAAEKLGAEVDMVKLSLIVKSTPETVLKRLQEFKATPSAAVEQRDLLDVDLEDREPPPFVKHKKLLKRERLAERRVSNRQLSQSNGAVDGEDAANSISMQLSANDATTQKMASKNCVAVAKVLYAEISRRSKRAADDGNASDRLVDPVPESVKKRMCGRFAMLVCQNSVAYNNSSPAFVTPSDLELIGENFDAAEDVQRYEKNSVQLAFDSVADMDLDVYKHSDEMRQLKTRMWLKKYDSFIKNKQQQMKRAAEEAAEAEKQAGEAGLEPSQQPQSSNRKQRGRRPVAQASATAASAHGNPSRSGDTRSSSRGASRPDQQADRRSGGGDADRHNVTGGGQSSTHQQPSIMITDRQREIKLSKTVNYDRMKQIFGNTLGHVEDLFS